MIEAEVAKILKQNQLANINIKLTTTPYGGKFGFQYQGGFFGVFKTKTAHNHELVFDTSSTAHLARNLPGVPKTTVYAGFFQKNKKQGYNATTVYANMIVHEILYHGVLGYTDSPLGTPGDFDNTNLAPGYLNISQKYISKIIGALTP